MLIATHFKETSIVAEVQGAIVGMVSAYIDPEQSDTLFVWQVAVDASVRGQRVASRMLDSLLQRPRMAEIRYIETTISPSNAASRNLFKRFAAELGTEMTERPYFGRELFGGEAHEDEHLFRIGPFTPNHH